MKLNPETLVFLRSLSKQERQAFLEYLSDADKNIKSEINHLDNELGYVHEPSPKTDTK
jgi:hypothetical protein